MAELTDTGFARRSEDEILQEMRQDAWDGISDRLDLSSDSPLGQVLGIFAERLALVEELAEAVYNARNPDSASGAALVALCQITGTETNEATKTTVACTVNIDSGFSAAAGEMVAHVDGDPTKRFVNRDAVENTTGSADNFPAVFEAETAGAIAVFAGELTVIAEALSGWNSITNALDGVTGLDDDTDTKLRERREDELQAQGSTTADAIRSDIIRNLADNITNCTVLVNEGDATDANGLPPHSFEVVARGLDTGAAASTALAKQILDSKAAADRAYGQSSEVVQDSQGNDHTIGYTWVTDKNVYFEVDLEIDEDAFPADGDTQVQQAIAALDAAFDPGDKVVAERIKAACFAVAGVVDVPALRLGFTASPVGTSNLTIGAREIASFDASRITVSHV